jgi:SAM-dependent methyltransferase
VSSTPFTSLALVYDDIMADIEYDEWSAFILETVRARGWSGGSLLDLGCGTGNATAPMVEEGFDVTGVDASAEMLAVARAKLPDTRFVLGDFETFDAGGTFTLAYAVFDALNNLLSPAAFRRAAERVYAHLEPNGLFMFDVNTTRGLKELWESGRAEGWAGEVYYNWRHSFDEDTGLARVDAFCLHGSTGFTEVHFERPYDPPELRESLGAAGFADVEILAYPEGEAAPHDAHRVWVVARRPPEP